MALPKTYILDDKSLIWLRPGDDFHARYSFYSPNYDATKADYRLEYQEREYRVQPHQHDNITPGSWTDADDEIDTSRIDDGILFIHLSGDQIRAWENNQIECQLIIDNGDREWVAQSFKLTVAQGA